VIAPCSASAASGDGAVSRTGSGAGVAATGEGFVGPLVVAAVPAVVAALAEAAPSLDGVRQLRATTSPGEHDEHGDHRQCHL